MCNLGRDRFGLPGLRGGRSHEAFRPLVMHPSQELCACNPVRDRVVDLGNGSNASPLEPFEDPELPEWTVSVEHGFGEGCYGFSKLPIVSRGGEADSTQVGFEGEARVFDPEGVTEVEGGRKELTSKGWEQVETLFEGMFYVVVGGVGGSWVWLEDRYFERVHGSRRGFLVEKLRVEPR